MAFYLANAASALRHRDREASDLPEWIADRENRTPFGGRKRPSSIRAGKRGRDEGMSGGRWRSLGEALREEYTTAWKARPDRTGQRLRRLARTTGLSRTNVDLLELVLRYQTQPVIESMIDDGFRSSRRFTPLNVQNPALPALLGVSANTVQGRPRADSPLVRSGLVCIDSDGDLKALDRLNRLAAAPAGSGADVHRLLLDAAPTPTLWTMNSPRGVSETILRRMMFALELRRPPASRTLPPSRPGTSRWCTGRRGSSENTGSRKHSPACFATIARRSRTGPARSDSGRRSRARQVPLPVVPPSIGARYHPGMSKQMSRKSAKCGTSK